MDTDRTSQILGAVYEGVDLTTATREAGGTVDDAAAVLALVRVDAN
jgi:hypothetical protein